MTPASSLLVITLISLVCIVPESFSHRSRKREGETDELKSAHVFTDEDDEHIQHHIREDLKLKLDVANMTRTHKDYYYFKLHDYDGNFRLDGLELLKGISHTYLEHTGEKEGGKHVEGEIQRMMAVFIDVVDVILRDQDGNYDGYLDYAEYARFMESKNKQRELREWLQKTKQDEQ